MNAHVKEHAKYEGRTRWRSEWPLTLKNLFFPIYCKMCGERLLTEENGFFCPRCWESAPRIERPFCSRCGRPHPGMVGLGTRSNFPCAECREKPNPHVRRIFGAACYEGAIEAAIKLLKFHRKERLAGPMGEVMAEFAQAEMACGAYDFVVPVPLHKVRARDRGFNQSQLLAREVMPVFPNATLDESLRRIRPTRAQSTLKGQDRQANVRGAFAVAGDRYAARTILLVDDVVTTAGTVTECASALHRAGAKDVDVLAFALAGTGTPFAVRELE